MSFCDQKCIFVEKSLNRLFELDLELFQINIVFCSQIVLIEDFKGFFDSYEFFVIFDLGLVGVMLETQPVIGLFKLLFGGR